MRRKIRKVVYKGQDPNVGGMKCEVINVNGDELTLVTGDSIIGRVEFKANINKVEDITM